MRNIIPVVMAGVLGIYGLIVAVVLIQAGACFALIVVCARRVRQIHSHDFVWSLSQAAVPAVQRFCTSRRRSFLRSLLSCCRLRDRHCRRRWCARERSAAEIVCRHDFDSHFRRGARSVWSYYCTHSIAIEGHKQQVHLMSAFSAG